MFVHDTIGYFSNFNEIVPVQAFMYHDCDPGPWNMTTGLHRLHDLDLNTCIKCCVSWLTITGKAFEFFHKESLSGILIPLFSMGKGRMRGPAATLLRVPCNSQGCHCYCLAACRKMLICGVPGCRGHVRNWTCQQLRQKFEYMNKSSFFTVME